MPSTPSTVYGFLTAADLQIELAAILKTTVGEMTANAPWWAQIVAAANVKAWNEIRRRWVARGYTLQQLLGLVPATNLAWDSGWEFQRDIGLYFCLFDGAALDEQKDVSIFDRRDELEGVEFTGGGIQVLLPPGHGEISYGQLSTVNDVFVAPTKLDDTRIGNLTRW